MIPSSHLQHQQQQFPHYHKSAKLLQQSLDDKFDSFAKMMRQWQQQGTTATSSSSSSTSSMPHSSQPHHDLNSLLNHIQQDIKNLSSSLDGMHSCCYNSDDILATTTPQQRAALERFREVHQEYLDEYRRMKRQWDDMQKRRLLFDGGLQQQSSSSGRNEMLSQRHLLDDSSRRLNNISNSISQMTSLGQETNASLAEQHERFSKMASNLTGMNMRFPVMDQIVGRIALRQRRDMIILSSVIGFFIVLSFMIIF